MDTGTATRVRPTGVTIIAILAIIGGIFSILGGLALLGLGGLGLGAGGPVAAAGGIATVLGGGVLLGGLLNLIFAWGAWTLKGWAWWWGVVANGLPVLSSLIAVLQGQQGLGGALFGGLVNVIILVYLLTPGARAAFGQFAPS